MRTLTLRYIARTGGSWGPGNVPQMMSGLQLRPLIADHKAVYNDPGQVPLMSHRVTDVLHHFLTPAPPPHKLVTENGASIIDQIQTKLECRAPGAKWGGWWVQRIMNIKLCDCRIAVIVLIIVDQGEYKWNMFCTPALSRKLILPHNLSDSKHWESEIWPTRYTLLYMPGKSWHCGAIFLLQLGQEQVVAWSNQHSPSDIIISGIIQ